MWYIVMKHMTDGLITMSQSQQLSFMKYCVTWRWM
nr:MAG TPA: hypothetical protein [Bacteriophage sp.]